MYRVLAGGRSSQEGVVVAGSERLGRDGRCLHLAINRAFLPSFLPLLPAIISRGCGEFLSITRITIHRQSERLTEVLGLCTRLLRLGRRT